MIVSRSNNELSTVVKVFTDLSVQIYVNVKILYNLRLHLFAGDNQREMLLPPMMSHRVSFRKSDAPNYSENC